MDNKCLYAVLLGGKIRENHLMEDHHLVFVIAQSEEEARKKAKKKWAAKEIHVDGTQKIEIIDGYKIKLEECLSEEDVSHINPKYSK